ncbi:hypothetical protein [Endozoicomonas ascidiicola]|uniref:hypothetical protein n=1 Tax=Endozoicomonas ascidiicola TaxID=1698521 RepID=UPI000832E4D9|nr:hypothetical protein [Endozoicomonas ascidiicola]
MKEYTDRISINTKSKAIRVCYGGRHSEQDYFPIKSYGNYSAALQAAIEFEKKLPATDRRGRCHPRSDPNINSQSGIVGVSPIHSKYTGDQLGWRAQWQEYSDYPNKRCKNKDFCFSIHGNRALEKAIDYRQQMVKENMEILDHYLNNPDQ